MNAPAEKIAGTDLTTIPAYSKTAIGLADLEHRLKNVIVDVSTPKGLKLAKENVAECRTLRTDLEKLRVEKKAPLLQQGKELDDEAKRITALIRAIEEPIKLQVDAKEAELEQARLAKLEAERLRVEAIQKKIQAIRDVPGSLVGKPSVIIAGQLAKLEAEVLDEDEFAEHFVTARDALEAAIARVRQQLADQQTHEAEQKRIAAEREELAHIRAENERLQREAEERAAEDRRREQVRVDAIRARIDGIRCMASNLDGLTAAELAETRQALFTMHPDTSGADFAEFRGQAVDTWDVANTSLAASIERRQQQEEAARQRAAEEQARREEEARLREEEEARLQAERERQAAEQKKLDEQAAQLKREREAAAAKAEMDRLANIGLREAAVDVMSWAEVNGHETAKPFRHLRAALANDAAENLTKPARTKRTARA